jgi:hypothetical protein
LDWIVLYNQANLIVPAQIYLKKGPFS